MDEDESKSKYKHEFARLLNTDDHVSVSSRNMYVNAILYLDISVLQDRNPWKIAMIQSKCH